MLRSKLAVWLYRHGMHRLAYIASPSVAHVLYMREVLAEMQNAARCAWDRSDTISTEPQERVVSEEESENSELSAVEIRTTLRAVVEVAMACLSESDRIDLTDYLLWLAATRWALQNHPEWVRIYRRTKKRRIRKKYRDRMMRAWRKEGGQ